MRLTELALRRAGAADLEEFQRREGLYPSGQEDILTMQRLTPLLLGYERYMVKPGDSFDQSPISAPSLHMLASLKMLQLLPGVYLFHSLQPMAFGIHKLLLVIYHHKWHESHGSECVNSV